MARPTLDDLTPDLDRACIDVLGEAIMYAADGAAFVAVQAYVNYRDMAQAFDAAKAIVQDMSVTFLKVDVPAEPTATARITLLRRPGKTYRPTNVRTDDAGTGWEFEVKEVA